MGVTLFTGQWLHGCLALLSGRHQKSISLMPRGDLMAVMTNFMEKIITHSNKLVISQIVKKKKKKKKSE